MKKENEKDKKVVRFDSVDYFPEEGQDGQNNWTFGNPEVRPFWIALGKTEIFHMSSKNAEKYQN